MSIKMNTNVIGLTINLFVVVVVVIIVNIIPQYFTFYITIFHVNSFKLFNN